MEEIKVTHSTFVIERSYPAKPERVFAAFAKPETKRRWYGEHRTIALEGFEMDFRVGGSDRISYRFLDGSPFPGTPLVNDTTYEDIVPNRRIVTAYRMTIGDHIMSASLGTFEFVATAEGTTLIFTEQGAYFEGSDGPKMREDGWRALLDKLGAEFES
jgi:uncharacterized protein YndB with AHSA1/START domain